MDKARAPLRWRAGAVGAGLAMALCGAAHAAPLPIKAFFEPPESRGAQLSPSGRYLSLIETTDHGEVVSVIDLTTHEKSVALRPKGGRDIDWVRWKGDDRLIAGLVKPGEAGEGDGPRVLDRREESLTALDRDGSDLVAFSDPGGAAARHDRPMRIADTLAHDPGHVLVEAPDNKGAPSLWKVDVHSGSAELVGASKVETDGRLPRGALIVQYNMRTRYAVKSDPDAEFDVLGPADGGRKAFVALQPRSKADGDTATVRIYDFAHKTLSEPVWPALKYDVSDVVYRASDKSLAGVCYTADTFTCDFKDSGLEADYKKAETFFHDDRNLTPLSMSDDGRFWLFGVSGPDEPGAYYVMDRKTGGISFAANRHPDLPADKLATMQRFVYTARDGTRIPAYLSLPPKAPAGPLPLIVMPHGGPEARDSLEFDIWAQVFATRGYAVLQPNFRGSSGYGHAWAEAGYREWGGLMQDDITDGVKALIAEGRVDPKRICIFGASFGGYAALYGGVETPELYKCVASFAGVSDLKALVAWEKATPGHAGRYAYASHAIGNPKKDAHRLEAASPIDHVDAYRVPVLLLHGSDDESVPVIQSERMEQALRKAGKAVRLIVVKGEGHSDWSPEHEQMALTQLAEFFKQNIGPGVS